MSGSVSNVHAKMYMDMNINTNMNKDTERGLDMDMDLNIFKRIFYMSDFSALE
jgi:hypothetical protein